MASCSNSAKEAESESSNVPNWLELPREITVNILQRLDTIDIVKIACQVCPLWWNICKEPIVWRTICMTSFSCSLYFLADFVKICRYAVERSCGHLEDIDIEYFCTNELLACITDNGSNLRRLRLLGCRQISNLGFSAAVRKLSQLEELDISLCSLSKESLEVIGISCPLLKSLKFDREWPFFNRSADDNDDEAAIVISETMSRLCHLSIKGNRLTNVGLLAILDRCPLIEYLDIQECYNLSLSGSLSTRCLEQIKDIRLPILNNYEDYVDDYYYADYRDYLLEEYADYFSFDDDDYY